jgi:hypothetical protein
VLSFSYLKFYCYIQSHPSVRLLHSGSFILLCFIVTYVINFDNSFLITVRPVCPLLFLHFVHFIPELFGGNSSFCVESCLFFSKDHCIVFLNHFFIYSYVHILFGPIFSPCPSFYLHPPHFQAESVLLSFPILLKRKHKR